MMHFSFDYDEMSSQEQEVAKAFCQALADDHPEWDVTWASGAIYRYGEDRFARAFRISGAIGQTGTVEAIGRIVVDAFGPAMNRVEVKRSEQRLATPWPHGQLRLWIPSGGPTAA